MASTYAVTMTTPAAKAARPIAGSEAFSRPLRLPAPVAAAGRPSCQLKVRASSSSGKETAATNGLTAVALAAALLIPDVAEAAQPGISPSLKNFLLSIVAGGVVLAVLAGAVVAVANFDPVKRS